MCPNFYWMYIFRKKNQCKVLQTCPFVTSLRKNILTWNPLVCLWFGRCEYIHSWHPICLSLVPVICSVQYTLMIGWHWCVGVFDDQLTGLQYLLEITPNSFQPQSQSQSHPHHTTLLTSITHSIIVQMGPSTSDGLKKSNFQTHLQIELDRRRRSTPASLLSRQSKSSNQSSFAGSSAADFYIPSLPGQPSSSSLTLYGGHLSFSPPDAPNPSNDQDDAYGFFFLNRARHIAHKQILMIWLNGGPGCSSFDGSLMEIGPLRMVLKGNGQLREAEGAWNEYVNMLFIDQPTGTGYSIGSEANWPHELDVSSDYLVNLLLRFFAIFPEYEAMDLYIGGESFAGQYIPYLGGCVYLQ